MKFLVLAAYFCFSISNASPNFIDDGDFQNNQTDLEVNLGVFNIESLIKGFGYPFEKHEITTDDGYVLEVHRVPYSKDSNTNTEGRPPLLIMHGLLGSSADFFHIGVGKSLPLRLADVGYDVWVGNNRGNTWSRKHSTLNPDKDTVFWDFSLDELGTYDAPAMIDYILATTKTDKLSYAGHSEGATQFFIMAASKPEYNEKVVAMAALAPTVYIQHASSILLRIVNSGDYASVLALEKKLNTSEFLDHGFILDVALGAVCKDGSKYQELCAALLFLIQGFDSSQLDRTILPQFFKTFPAGISFKELNHIFQLRISGEFRQYDYGKIKNMDEYKNMTPPTYDLKNISVPVAVFFGQNDLIVSEQDIGRLTSELPNATIHQIKYPNFNHLDFLLARDVDSLVNFDIINWLNEYNGLPLISTTTTTTTTTTTKTTLTPPTTLETSTTTTIDTSTTTGSSSITGPIQNMVLVQAFIVVLWSIFKF